MGKVSKGVKCSVIGCNNEAERSISAQRAYLSNSLKLPSNISQAYLCKEHYKVWKKDTKEIREIERLRW
ncbi:MAG TPA: hypothetical protein VKU94_04785 [Geobacterales bacterium]|nr:hypothetical protein [Geobacterales bacterium]